METKTERLDGDKVRFDITIDAKEVDEAIDSVYDEVKKTARIPGFRKGKTPRTVLEHQFGADYFASRATVDLIEKHSPEVVDSADMVPIGDYDYDAEDSVEPGKDYSYSFTIQVKPEYELSSADPVSVKVLSPVATAEEIDKQIELLRSYYIDLKEVEDRPVQNDDIVVYSQECSIDGEDIEDGKEDSRTYVVGAGASSAEFDQQIIGMKIGETKDFIMAGTELGLGDKYPKPVTARVTVNKITEKAIPELTDEWAKSNCGVDDVEALRKQVGDSITSEKERGVEREKATACLDELSSRLQGEIPEYMKIEETTKALRNLYNSLQQSGYTLDQYLMATGQSADDFYKDVEAQAETMAKQDLSLDALARALEMECTEEDVNAAFDDADVEDPAALLEEWREENRMAVLHEGILRDKAAKWLYDNAKVEFVDELPEEPAEDETAEAPAEEVAAEAAVEETPAEEAAADDTAAADEA